MALTADEIDWIITCPKRVTARVEWKPKGGKTARAETTFSVLVPAQDDPERPSLGRIEGVSSQFGTKMAFIYGNLCIRRWESHGPHTNPDGKRIEGQHKHTWDDIHEDRLAYIPDDIDITNRDTILRSFLDECAITLEGVYEPELRGLGGTP